MLIYLYQKKRGYVMDRDLSRLIRGYTHLKEKENYSTSALELSANTRREVYESKNKLPKEEVLLELKTFLGYLESGLFSSYYAFKKPNKIISLVRYAGVNIESVLDKEGYFEALEMIHGKLTEIFKGLKTHPRENSNKFGPVKKALKAIEIELETLNTQTSRRSKDKEEMAD